MRDKKQCGQLGGITTLLRYGQNYMKELGKTGGRPRLIPVAEGKEVPTTYTVHRTTTTIKATTTELQQLVKQLYEGELA